MSADRTFTTTPTAAAVAPSATPTAAVTPAPSAAPTSTPTPGWSEEFSSGVGTMSVFQGSPYVSGGVLNMPQGSYLLTLNGPTFTHGYFEARVKFPVATGYDAAFWLKEPWANGNNEIDIVEAYPNSVKREPYNWQYQATEHIESVHNSGSVSSGPQITYSNPGNVSLADSWHTYAVDWVPGSHITFYFDGVEIGSMTPVMTAWAMRVCLSYTKAGAWNPTDSTTPASSTMQVDWVRWWDTMPTR